MFTENYTCLQKTTKVAVSQKLFTVNLSKRFEILFQHCGQVSSMMMATMTTTKNKLYNVQQIAFSALRKWLYWPLLHLK